MSVSQLLKENKHDNHVYLFVHDILTRRVTVVIIQSVCVREKMSP